MDYKIRNLGVGSASLRLLFFTYLLQTRHIKDITSPGMIDTCQ